MEFDFDLYGGIYPKGARHNGLLCDREARSGVQHLHKTPLCWMPPHTNNRRSRPRLARTLWGARHVQATTAPAACERRALDGAAALCGAMKRDSVKRRRQRSGHTRNEAIAEGGFIAFCALSDATGIAMARGLQVCCKPRD
jgi:hypothetical protein